MLYIDTRCLFVDTKVDRGRRSCWTDPGFLWGLSLAQLGPTWATSIIEPLARETMTRLTPNIRGTDNR